MWKPSEMPAGAAFAVKTGKADKAGKRSEQLCLLPVSSKSGENMRKVSGLKGAALRVYARHRSDELLQWEAKEFAGLASSGEWTGHSVRVNKLGSRLTFTLVKVDKVALPMSTQDMLKALGLTAEQVEAAKALAAGSAVKVKQGALSV